MLNTLLDPDIGLLIWTAVSFLVLVGLLRLLAWGPLLEAVEGRERGLREEREAAEKARAEAEKIRKELSERLLGAEAQAKELLAQVNKDAEVLRGRRRKEAEDEAKGVLDKTRAQLAEERQKVIGELRGEVAALSVLAAERLVRKSIDAGVRKSVMDGFLKELESSGKLS